MFEDYLNKKKQAEDDIYEQEQAKIRKKVDLSTILDNFGGTDNTRLKGTLTKDLKKLEEEKKKKLEPVKLTRKE